MSIYTYTVKLEPNKTTQGRIEAGSQQEATDKLTKLGYFPILVEVEDTSLSKQGLRRLGRFSRKEVVHLTSQLSILIEAGVNIINSLNILFNQTQNSYFRPLLEDIIKMVKDGKSLSGSLAVYPKVFPSLYIAMVHAGEVGGNIDITLRRLADFLEKDEEFKSSLRGALIYPFFIIALSILTVAVLLGFVVPKLSTMFEDMGQSLPLPTKILFGISGYFAAYGWAIVLFIFILIFLVQRLRRAEQGRVWLDSFKLKFPVLGEVTLKTEIGRLFRTLALLLSNGVHIVSALEVCVDIVENQILRSGIKRIKEQISGGSTLSKSFKEAKLFPPLVDNIITVGEEGGTLEKSLLRIADEYERDADRLLKTLVRILEPAVILVMGLVVGFIVVSVLLPIFQINLVVK